MMDIRFEFSPHLLNDSYLQAIHCSKMPCPKIRTLALALAREFFPHPYLYYHFDYFFGVISPPKLSIGTSLFERETCIRTLKVQPPNVVYKVRCLLPESRLLGIAWAYLASCRVFIPFRKQEPRKTASALLLFRIRNDLHFNGNACPHISCSGGHRSAA